MNLEAHLARIAVIRDSGNAEAAVAASEKALAAAPGEARLHYAVALCLEDANRAVEALEHYDRAIDIHPVFEDALHNRGVLLSRLGKFASAESNQLGYIKTFPQSRRAHSVLVDVLLALHRYSDALDVLDRLEHLAPGDAIAQLKRGSALASLRRLDESRAAFTTARARDPRAVEQHLQRIAAGSDPRFMLSPENIYLASAWSALGRCDWSAWDASAAEMRRVARSSTASVEPAVAFMSLHAPVAGPERCAVATRAVAWVEVSSPLLPELSPVERPRLRIGVLTPDFRDHVMGYMLTPLFELADRSRFETYAYSLTSGDGSAVRARIRSAATLCRDLSRLSDREAALAIRGDDIDILIDPAGHTTGARFAVVAQRPARLHVNYLGFSGSLGSTRVDYAIVDRVVGHDADEWIEARAFLPDTFALYDFRDPEPTVSLSRKEYGVPEGAFVFCAFHKPEKISPDSFDAWMHVLRLVPQSVLWMRAISDIAAASLRKQAELRSVNPTRLLFAPFEPVSGARYLARQALGDLLLDALHHNAINSACDGLRVGLPVLTLQGTAMASRACASLLYAANLPELVTRDRDSYVELAAQLATDPELLRSFKQRLVANRHSAPLFDTANRVRQLEAAFEEMYRRMRRGEPPASFDVRA